ncbi:MAG TPA: ATPase, T2SS/T4P/T4SS family [Vicinamibacteria bacterium]
MANTDPSSAPSSSAPKSRRRFLGEMLVRQGVITSDQLAECLQRQKLEPGSRLGRLLVDFGYATDNQICEAIAEQLQIPAADMVAVDVPNDVLSKVSKELATKHVCLPWFVQGRELFLIMADPTNVAAADAIAFHTGLKVKPVVAPESEIISALERFYASEETTLAQLGEVGLAEQLSVVAEDPTDVTTDEDAEQAALGGPVVKLVNAILADAIRANASDIHIEPREKGLELRYRVDGLLRKVMSMPKRVQNKMLSRIKIMSHMDISERRKPQDGRTFVRVGNASYDLRVSTLPTSDGEKAVLRILSQTRALVKLEELGFDDETLTRLRDIIRRPQGLILVTGPTGSGKTSTLYAAVNFLRSETTNIVTIEDPVECRLPGINQVAVSDKSGMTFAAGLRSILRQDPDVIMVGEIRDLETAKTAFQAAQTGHLVLSTLHTNDAASTVTRLVEMGLPAYVVAGSLLGVLAQRLARRLCDCKTVTPQGAQPKGCDACRFTGYRGRVGLYELMTVNARVRSVVLGDGSVDPVRRAARMGGMRSLFQDGQRKAAAGVTTLDEVRRVVPPDEEVGDAEAGAAPAVAGPLSAASAQDRPPRILVVDDDRSMLEALQDTLEAEQYDVLVARDGEEALATVFKEQPDLVLTDLQMPGLDGMGLLRRLRSDLSTCQIPVIFLTVVESLDSEAQALNLGADDYISKPVQRSRLLGRIRRSLLRAHMMQ